jgi:hypothetical protein
MNVVIASTTGDVAGPVSSVVVALIGFAGLLVSKRVREQTTPERRPSRRRKTSVKRASATTDQPRVISSEVEGFLVRFFVFTWWSPSGTPF